MASASEKAASKKLLRARSSMAFCRCVVLRAAARLPGILAGFSADLGLGLRPGQRRKALRHARGLNKVVGHVDEELEGQAEAVFDEPRRKEHRLGRAERRVAVADRRGRPRSTV